MDDNKNKPMGWPLLYTLATVGPIYGVVKKQDESWKHYHRRILKAAQTIDTVQLPTGKRAPDDRRTEGKK